MGGVTGLTGIHFYIAVGERMFIDDLFHDGWTTHEDQPDCFIAEGFLKKDFGPWKAELGVILTFDLLECTIKRHDSNGEIMTVVRYAHTITSVGKE